MLNLQKVTVTQGEGVNNFWLEPNPEYDAEAEAEAQEKAINSLGEEEE